MIRIYLDWNVMSQIKNGNHQLLSKILKNDEKFIKVFSTSHISDISSSAKEGGNIENIQADLDFISDFTDETCVYNTGENVVIEQRSPHELFNERFDLSDIFEDFSFQALAERLSGEDNEALALVMPLLNNLKNLPIDSVFKEAFENPDTRTQMEQFLPDLKGNYTMENLLSSIWKMFRRLNEEGDYKGLREMVQQGLKINKDKVFDAADPQKMIDSAYKALKIEMPILEPPNNTAPEWYNTLTNEYIKLDMHGYQQDKVNVGKGRKETFKNTTEDAFHAAFASTCNFYITSDKKSYRKTEHVYEKHHINTIVFSPKEFVDHYNEFLHYSEGEKFLSMIAVILQHGEPNYVSEDGHEKIYLSFFFIFDFFNKITTWYHPESGKYTLMLSRLKPTNYSVTFLKEIDAVVNKMYAALGEDMASLGRSYASEMHSFAEGNWEGRKWLKGDIVYHLRLLNGYLQIYLNSND